MEKLLTGLHRFRAQIFADQRALFERLVGGQSPDALFITCSDSRINPNLFTQTEPGELFILRNAGNVVPAHGSMVGGEAATIEYAVAALGIRDIIVCGHSHCGAMQALLDPSLVDELPAMARWLGHCAATRQIVQENYGHLEPTARLMAAIEENVLTQIEHLQTLPVVAARLSRGALNLHAWVYQMETGEVFAFDASEGQYRPVSAQPPLPTLRARNVDGTSI